MPTWMQSSDERSRIAEEVLQEQLAKGMDRLVAEERARAAAVAAVRKKHRA